MDAALPLRRWLLAASLLPLPAAGCASSAPAVGRGQVPADPAAPVAPTPPQTVPGQPVPPAAGPVQAGYVPGGPGLARKLLPDGTPQVKMVAQVGAAGIVTDQEVWESVRQRMNEYISLVDGPQGKEVVRDDAKEKELYQEELRRTIERELILNEMFERLKRAKKAEVVESIRQFAGQAADKQLMQFRKQYQARSDEEFRSILATQGLTLPVIRRQLERQVMADEYVRTVMKEKGKAVSPPLVREYYERHPDEFMTEDRVKWLDIFVSTNRFESARQAHDHAEAVRRQAAGGADFAALSKQHDQGFAALQNGEGAGTTRGKIQPADVEPVVWGLKPGEVSGLVETPTGYHVVKVVDRQVAGVRPFDEKTQAEVRAKLLNQIHKQEYRRMVDELWRKGGVQVLGGP